MAKVKAKIQIVHDVRAVAPLLIGSYIHCGRCIDEMPTGVSPKKWARTQAGMTADGIQVWCTRHDINVDTWTIRLEALDRAWDRETSVLAGLHDEEGK